MNHTPAPWRSDNDDSAICAGPSMTLARVYWGEERTEEEDRANAHLIAAAPDLLAALKEFRLKEEYVVGAQGQHLILRVPLDAIQKAAAAIAKAEGRS
jgi:hypothetical protein